jgi:hypothetical protein
MEYCGQCPVCDDAVELSDMGSCQLCGQAFHWSDCGDWSEVGNYHVCNNCKSMDGHEDLDEDLEE